MSRSTRRISRALLVGLGGTLALGLVFWLGNLAGSSRARQAESERSAAEPREQMAMAQLPPAAVAIGAGELTPAPATQPAPVALAGVTQINVGPSTRPTQEVQLASLTGGAGRTTEPRPVALSTAPLADAKAKLDAGKHLNARNILSAALSSGALSEADVKAAKDMLDQVNAVVVFSSQRFPDDEFGGTFNVPSGAVLAKIASSHDVTAELLMRINGIKKPESLQAGRDIKVLKGPFHATVSTSTFRLELWQGEPGAKGSRYVTSFPVGLGKDDSTPTGVWAVQNKLPNPAYYSPRGEGVIAADDPANPLGEYWIGLTGTDGHAVGKQSYGIHGTIDPNSIGKQESMGCIRLKNEDVAQVYQMLVEGKSTVTVTE